MKLEAELPRKIKLEWEVSYHGLVIFPLMKSFK